MTGRDHVYMFLHIPKTGGSSLRFHIRKNFAHRRLITTYRSEHAQAGDSYFARAEVANEWARCRVVMGHAVSRDLTGHVGGRPVRYFTVFRDPAVRLISQYNWQCHITEQRTGRPQEPFEKWLRRPHRRNGQARRILHTYLGLDSRSIDAMDDAEVFERARDALGEFWLVGSLENLEASMAPLFSALGLPAAITVNRKVAAVEFTRRLDKTDAALGLAAQYCVADQKLYDAFCR